LLDKVFLDLFLIFFIIKIIPVKISAQIIILPMILPRLPDDIDEIEFSRIKAMLITKIPLISLKGWL